jgi:hypothetical protein
MKESFKYLGLNFIRKLPNKGLIAFIAWFMIGVSYNKFKIIKSYWYNKIKERDEKRKFLFKLTCKIHT